MRTIINFSRFLYIICTKVSIALLATLLVLISPSCQKDESKLLNEEFIEGLDSRLTSELDYNSSTLYYGRETFTRGSGKPFMVTGIIENPKYDCFDGNFVLKIKNGKDKRTRVSSAEIRIDGVLIAGPSDFSKNATLIIKPLSGLMPHSKLEVKLSSSPGSFIELWIEGTINIITPSFTQIGPLEQKAKAPALPDTSNNGIIGIWFPETINTDNPGTYVYTFTPSEGQCAKSITMIIDVEINNAVVSDVEGNVYKTVKIGNQLWMAENLKTTRYNNNELISTTYPTTLDISGESSPKYQWAYKGIESYANLYGRLYTWYAVTDSRGVCPSGWHVPSVAEWTIFENYLIENGYNYDGTLRGNKIAKSLASATNWMSSDNAGSVGNIDYPEKRNATGFTALPGGYRDYNGLFFSSETNGFWWSSTEYTAFNNAWYWIMRFNTDYIEELRFNKESGFSVRCLKD